MNAHDHRVCDVCTRAYGAHTPTNLARHLELVAVLHGSADVIDPVWKARVQRDARRHAVIGGVR